jgi:hypothetical protein
MEKETGRSLTATEKSWKGLQTVGKVAAVAVAGAAVAIGVTSVKMAADFQRASTRLVTDAGESAKNLKMVQSGMLDLSAATGKSAKDIASGMYIVESAGYHGAAGLSVMKAVAEGATIGMADTKTVADALTTTLTDYGKAAGSPAQAMTMLTATVSTGKTNMEALAGSLHSVMPAAASAGISLKELLGAVGTMTAEGISADQATQNLNNAISSLMSPSQVAQKEMAQMGLSFLDVSQHLGARGLTGTLQMLSDAVLQHMGPDGLVIQSAMNQSKIAAQSAREEMAQMPPQMRKMAQAFLDNQITQKQWTASLKTLPIETANLGKQFAVTAKHAAGFGDLLKSGGGVAQTYNAAMQKMTGGMTGLQVALHLTGDHMGAFKGNVASIGRATTETGGHVMGWAETQKTLNVQLAQAGAAIGKMAIQLGTALIPFVSSALKWLEGFAGALAKNPPLLITIASIVGGILLAAIIAYTAAMISAAIATTAATWPIMLILLAIGLLVAGIVWLITNWQHVADFIVSVWTNIASFFQTVIGAIVSFVKAHWGMLLSILIGPLGFVVQWVVDNWPIISKVFSVFFDHVSGVFKGIGAVIGWFWKTASAIFTLLFAIIGKVLGPVFTWLWKNIAEPAFKGIGLLIQILGLGFTWLWKTAVQPAINTIGSVVTWLWKTIILPAFQGIGGAIRLVWDTLILPTLTKFHDFIFKTLPDAFTTFGKIVGIVWNAVKTAALAPVKFVIDTVYNGGIVKAFNAAADFFEGSGATHLPTISTGFAGGGVIPGYQSARRDDILMPMRRGEGVLVPEVVRALGPGFIHALNAAGNRGGVHGVRSLVGMAGGGIVGDILGNIGSFVSTTIGDIGSFVSNPLGALNNIVGGLMKSIPGGGGIVKMLGGFGSKVIGEAVTMIKSLFGISQSKAAASGGGGAQGNVPGSGVTRWTSDVVAALAANGLSTSSDMVARVLRQMQTESGGNPSAVQNGYVDVNTISGDLAKGLMQTISATFNAYAFPGHHDIFNGYDNLLAALNYAKHAYGPGLSALGNGHGYGNGGWIAGPDGAPIMALNHGGEYMLSRSMLAGRQPIDPRVRAAVAGSGGGGSTTINHGATNNITVNAHTNASPQQISQSIAWEMWRLT